MATDSDAPAEPGSSGSFWLKFLLGYLVVQAIIGHLLFSHCWEQVKHFRRPTHEAVNAKFPMFRRPDDPPTWSKSTFYPWALLLMPTRFFFIVLLFLTGTCTAIIVSIGHDFSQGPIKGVKRDIMMRVTSFVLYFIVWLSGMKVERKRVSADYTEFLGQDYQIKMKKPRHTATIVSNHCSWLDGPILIQQLGCGIAPDAGFAEAPFLGKFFKAIDSLFLPRSKGEKDKEDAMLGIKKR